MGGVRLVRGRRLYILSSAGGTGSTRGHPWSEYYTECIILAKITEFVPLVQEYRRLIMLSGFHAILLLFEILPMSQPCLHRVKWRAIKHFVCLIV